MMQSKVEFFKITEIRNGCVYKTKRISHAWLETKPRTEEEKRAVAVKFGGDMWVDTVHSRTVDKDGNVTWEM